MAGTIETFFSAWCIPDPDTRQATISSTLAEGASYADPRTPEPLTDVAAISAYVGMFIEAAPGATVEVTKADVQHGLTRATIAFRMADGMEQAGQYFIEIDNTGQITRMIGFVGTGAV